MKACDINIINKPSDLFYLQGTLGSTYSTCVYGSQATAQLQIPKNQYPREQHAPYKCTTCGKGFRNRRDLRGHMSWHTGIKEFKCDICLKEFRYEHHYKVHMNSHSTMELHKL